MRAGEPGFRYFDVTVLPETFAAGEVVVGFLVSRGGTLTAALLALLVNLTEHPASVALSEMDSFLPSLGDDPPGPEVDTLTDQAVGNSVVGIFDCHLEAA